MGHKNKIWKVRPSKKDQHYREQIESAVGKMGNAQFLHYCIEYTAKNHIVGIKEDIEKHTREIAHLQQKLNNIEKAKQEAIVALNGENLTENVRLILEALDIYEQSLSPHNNQKPSQILIGQAMKIKENIPAFSKHTLEGIEDAIKDRTLLNQYFMLKHHNGGN